MDGLALPYVTHLVLGVVDHSVVEHDFAGPRDGKTSLDGMRTKAETRREVRVATGTL